MLCVALDATQRFIYQDPILLFGHVTSGVVVRVDGRLRGWRKRARGNIIQIRSFVLPRGIPRILHNAGTHRKLNAPDNSRWAPEFRAAFIYVGPTPVNLIAPEAMRAPSRLTFATKWPHHSLWSMRKLKAVSALASWGALDPLLF